MSIIKRKQLDLTLSSSPTDGNFGLPGLNVASILGTDKMEDAFDKVAEILDKLAPPKPPKLNDAAVSMIEAGGISANQAATGTLFNNIFRSNNTPNTNNSVTFSGAHTKNASIDPVSNNKFYTSTDPTESLRADLLLAASVIDSSVNTGLLGGTVSGTRTTLTTALADYFAGVAGKSNFWNSYLFNGTVSTTGLTAGSTYTVNVSHKDTTAAIADVKSFSFSVEDGTISPTILNGAVVIGGPTLTKSGITFYSNPTAQITADLAGFYKYFFKNGNIYSITNVDGNFSNVNQGIAAIFASLPAANTNKPGQVVTLTSIANKYYKGVSTFNLSLVDAFGVTGTLNGLATGSILIDTYGVEPSSSLYRVATTAAPASVYAAPVLAAFQGSIKDTDIVTFRGTNDLQYEANQYHYPNVDYTNFAPGTSSPNYNYTTLTGDRFADFYLGSQSLANFTINLGGMTGAFADADSSVFIKVGASPWYSCNANFSSGDAEADGRAVLNNTSPGTVTARQVTLPGLRTGAVYLRVRLAQTSVKNFSFPTIS